jgi:hypothetical protein
MYVSSDSKSAGRIVYPRDGKYAASAELVHAA